MSREWEHEQAKENAQADGYEQARMAPMNHTTAQTCECAVRFLDHGNTGGGIEVTGIQYCPTHAAAPDYELALQAIADIEVTQDSNKSELLAICLNIARLTLAKGRS